MADGGQRFGPYEGERPSELAILIEPVVVVCEGFHVDAHFDLEHPQ